MNIFWLVLGAIFLIFGGIMIGSRNRIPARHHARGMTRVHPPMLWIVLGGMIFILGVLWLIDGIIDTV